MRRLIWGFAGRTYLIVGNLMSRLIYRCTFRCHFTIKSIFLISYLFWYHKIDFTISQNELDFFNNKFDFWYHKIECVILQHQAHFVISKSIYWYKNMISIAFAQGRLCLPHSTMLQRYQNLVLAICVPFMREVKALSSLHICTGSPETSALDNTIKTTTPCAGANSDYSDTYTASMLASHICTVWAFATVSKSHVLAHMICVPFKLGE